MPVLTLFLPVLEWLDKGKRKFDVGEYIGGIFTGVIFFFIGWLLFRWKRKSEQKQAGSALYGKHISLLKSVKGQLSKEMVDRLSAVESDPGAIGILRFDEKYLLWLPFMGEDYCATPIGGILNIAPDCREKPGISLKSADGEHFIETDREKSARTLADALNAARSRG